MTKEIAIGSAADPACRTLPAEIELEGAPYWLVREGEDGYKLLLALCPHAGGDVRRTEELFYCPLHFWTFDLKDGRCLNESDERLMRRDVVVRDGVLIAVGENY